jgi:hypothetical protein
MTLYIRLIRRASEDLAAVRYRVAEHTADCLEHVICKCGTSVGRGYCCQRENFEVGGLKLADHVSCVKTSVGGKYSSSSPHTMHLPLQLR